MSFRNRGNSNTSAFRGGIMRLRNFIALCLISFSVISASAQDFSGRYHCGGQWTDFQLRMKPVTGLLGVVDPDAGVTAKIDFYFHRSNTNQDAATYFLAGPYDSKHRHFHLETNRTVT